jgi:hypothetical protein
MPFVRMLSWKWIVVFAASALIGGAIVLMAVVHWAEHRQMEAAPHDLRTGWSSEGLSSVELAVKLRNCDRRNLWWALSHVLEPGVPYDRVIEVLGPPDDVWPTERLRREHSNSYSGAAACIWYKMGRCSEENFEVIEICFNQDKALSFWSGWGLPDSHAMAGYDDTRADQQPWSD